MFCCLTDGMVRGHENTFVQNQFSFLSFYNLVAEFEEFTYLFLHNFGTRLK